MTELHWLLLALVCALGSTLLIHYASKLERANWIWGTDAEAAGQWKQSGSSGVVHGNYGAFIAPDADLPQGYKLPSTAPILENPEVTLERPGPRKSKPKSSAD